VACVAAAQLTSIESAQQDILQVLSGYERLDLLRTAERKIQTSLIAARLMMNLIIPIWQRMRQSRAPHGPDLETEVIEAQFELARRVSALRLDRVAGRSRFPKESPTRSPGSGLSAAVLSHK
jgi:hypothetical protein